MRWAVPVVMLVACSAEEPAGDPDFPGPRYQTEHAEVRTEFEPQLCQRELEQIDTKVEELVEIFGVDPPERLVVRLADGFPPPSCPPGGTGCFNEPIVSTMWLSLEHELVHAVSEPLGIEAPFWREGLAEAYGGTRLVPGNMPVSEALDARVTGALDYQTAGHFVQWLIEMDGLEALLRAAKTNDFRAVYGATAEELEARYIEEAPWVYPGSNACWGTPLDFDGSDLDVEIEVSCDDDSSSRIGGPIPYAGYLGVTRVLSIQEAGTFEFLLEGGHCLFIDGCADAIVEEEPGPMDAAAGAPEGYVAAEEPWPFWLAAGSYSVVLYANEFQDIEDVRLRIRRVDG